MAGPQDPDGIEARRFRWEQVVAVAGALAAVGNWLWTEHQAGIQAARADRLDARVEANARAARQMELLPQVLGLLREGKCDSDLAAVTLLREASNYQEPSADTGEPFGRAAARACLTLLKTRQQATQGTAAPYCGCESLRLVTTLTESGRDAELARIAADISALARESGGPCGRLLAEDRLLPPGKRPPVALARLGEELDAAARSVSGERYTVVLGNDQDCEQARTSYRRSAEALARGLERFDRGLLRLQAGTGRWSSYLVTTYGNLTLEDAGQLVTSLPRLPGIRPDVYWARASTYAPQSRCAPP